MSILRKGIGERVVASDAGELERRKLRLEYLCPSASVEVRCANQVTSSVSRQTTYLAIL